MKDTRIFKSKYFIISIPNEKNWTPNEKDWTLHKRLSKEESKDDGKKFDDNIFAKIFFTKPDEFKCTQMNVSGENYFSIQELDDIIKFYFSLQDGSYFIRLQKSSLRESLLKNLQELKFVDDPVDSNFLYLEKTPAQMFPAFWLLGLGCGTSFGAGNNNLALGMCIGMSIGMCLGFGIDASRKKDFEKLKSQRISGK